MTEVETLLKEFEFVWRGDESGHAWYGPAMLPLIQSISEETATQKLSGAHTIGELVLHIASWQREVARRLMAGDWREPEDGDWPEWCGWKDSVARLRKAHKELRDAVAELSDEDLDTRIGTERDPKSGTGVSLRAMIHGIIQHNVYHLGQIAILQRALESRQSGAKA